ncbi:MAG TPA: hypothetical protein VGM07_00100 [Stellaceae bacterium]
MSTARAHATGAADAQVEAVWGVPPWEVFAFRNLGAGSETVASSFTLNCVTTSPILWEVLGISEPPHAWCRDDLGLDSTGFLPPGPLRYTEASFVPRCGLRSYADKIYVTCELSEMPPPLNHLHLLDPFLLGAKSLADIDLAALPADVMQWYTVTATGLAADNASAAIALWQTKTKAAVTFTTNDGTTLLPYRNDFLLPRSLAAGSSRLTVPAAQLFKAGSYFYAAVLVQAPLAGAARQVPGPVTVTATQGSTQEQVSIDLVPPPVILVHGIWGDEESLQQIESYLTARSPWHQRPDLVQAIQYENDIAFDSLVVAAPLNAAVNNAIQALDSAHIVGGRVDIVAHSMGGLAARDFALFSAYRQPRNRDQGWFHQIVTLDTPETGSELATYLYEHRGCILQRAPGSTAGLVWLDSCGISPFTNVQECFAAIGLSLGPPDDLESGALYSLEPDGSHLKTLNSDQNSGPNIPGTIWRAVSATAPANSLLKFELNELIAATANLNDADETNCPLSSKTPTVDAILNGANDGVVTAASQTKGAAADQFVKLSGLAHTTADPAGLTLDPHGSNANVEDSGAVESLVACWLRTDGATTCKPAAATASSVAAAVMAPTAPLHYAGALAVEPAQNLQLGTPAELTVTAPEAGVQELIVDETDELGHHAAAPATITRVVGRTVYTTVVPTLLGSVTFSLHGSFSDGGVSFGAVTLPVKAPAQAPQVFRGDADWRVFLVDPDDPNGLDFAELHPQAVYAAAPNSTIDLDGRVTCAVVPSAGKPVIQIYDGCWFKALGPGTATIEVRFGAIADRIEVISKHE